MTKARPVIDGPAPCALGSRVLAFVGACALTFAASACASGRSDPKWLDAHVEAPSDNVLWEVTVIALEKNGFPIGSGLDRTNLTAISGWHTSLAPFKGEGYRERCHVVYTPKEGRGYDVRVRVERERNDDIVRPLDLSYAQWEPDPDDERRAGMVLGFVRTMLGGQFQVEDRDGPASRRP